MRATRESESYIPLSEVVYRKLRRAIVQGDLAQGATVSETELARQLEVSKTPVRHALTRLTQEGLLVSTPHKGAVVTSLTRSDLEEIHLLRMQLEGLAARMAADRRTDADAQALRARLDELAGGGDAEERSPGCVPLHQAIWQASRTRRLPAILLSLQDYMEMWRLAPVPQPSASEDCVEEHAQVVRAILARDANGAEQAMARHISRALSLVRGSACADDAQPEGGSSQHMNQ